MTQELKTNITIQIPDKYALVEKVELEELEQKAKAEWVKGLDWLTEQSGIKSPTTLREKILYPYREELESFVDFPEVRGEHWYFNVVPMKKWLRNNFRKVVR